MTPRVVVIGAGVGGLGAALALARRGIAVSVVDRDPGPPAGSGEDSFLSWDRRGVPQFRQPHAFSARSRNLLLERAPDVLDLLAADGIEDFNIVHMLVPADQQEEGDERFTGILSRRPAFELALRRAVEREDRVALMSPMTVVGLLYEADAPVLTVSGVRLSTGEELRADMVIDAGGRRSAVSRWLAEAGALVPTEVEDCHLTYLTRHYRQLPTSTLFRPLLLGARADLGYLLYQGFPGDHGTFSILVGLPPWDEDLRVLRRSWAWDAALGAFPALAAWIRPDNAEPVGEVEVMAGQQNLRRRMVVDGEPVVLGVLPVGDSLCTTNPAYGWGASMALTHSFAAVDAVATHGDPRGAAVAYHEAVAQEADDVFNASVAMDRVRTSRWQGRELPPSERVHAEREDLINDGVFPGAARDPLLLRAFLRRLHLLEPPDALFSDDEVVRRATAVQERVTSGDPTVHGPSRAALVDLLRAARPTPLL